MRAAAVAIGLFLALQPASARTAEGPGAPMGPLGRVLLQEAEAAGRDSETRREAQRAAEEQERLRREAEGDAELAEARANQRAEAAGLEDALSLAQALQEELLRVHRNPSAEAAAGSLLAAPDPLASAGWEHDPRIAAPAPSDRELPLDIFDPSETLIAPGTWQNAEPLRVIRLVLDADSDGKPELVRFLDPASRELLREEADRNYDGVLDAWTTYTDGKLHTRVLDENDDGNPDVFETYRHGLLAVRELDRDDDGVRDVFYRYRDDSLFEEGHDADNDGVVDLLIVYEERRRVRAEEDLDRDGRMDMWTRYAPGAPGEEEKVARIERDQEGRGYADTFEFFRFEGAKTLLVRRERDIDGDGQVDTVSFYLDGRLRRRQISDASLLPR